MIVEPAATPMCCCAVDRVGHRTGLPALTGVEVPQQLARSSHRPRQMRRQANRRRRPARRPCSSGRSPGSRRRGRDFPAILPVCMSSARRNFRADVARRAARRRRRKTTCPHPPFGALRVDGARLLGHQVEQSRRRVERRRRPVRGAGDRRTRARALGRAARCQAADSAGRPCRCRSPTSDSSTNGSASSNSPVSRSST